MIQNQTNVLLISNLPLKLLASHISLPNMKMIASVHNLTFHSKIKADTLQKLISEHICQSCNDYTTVFICIDLNEQSEKTRKIKVEKVKQYQSLNSEKFKASNLEAVKQYQASSKGRANNLVAVKC